MSIPFEAIAAAALAQAETLVPQWLPHGKRRGHEWVCGDLYGEVGDSTSINLRTGLWKDFAGGPGGKDLIALYAEIHSIGQGEAAHAVARQCGMNADRLAPAPPPPKPVDPPYVPVVVQAGHEMPACHHPAHGAPSSVWTYRTGDGDTFCVIARYDPPDGRKQVVPWTWDGERWRAKGLPAPRPLFNLDKLAAAPGAKVLVVEGEKAAVAAETLAPAGWVVTTWQGGAQASPRTDWAPLAGRDATLWPDHDAPGREAAVRIAADLTERGAKVRVIDTAGDDLADGWDAADAIAAGMTRLTFIAWAKARVRAVGEGRGEAPGGMAPHPPVAVEPGAAATTTGAGEPGSTRGTGADAVPPQDSKPPARRKRPALGVVAPDGNVVPAAPPDEEPSAVLTWQELGLATNDKGQPHCNIDNVNRILAKHPEYAGKFWFDAFRERSMFEDQPWTGAHDLRLTIWIQRALQMAKMSTDTVAAGVEATARNSVRDPVVQWLDGLEWDGKDRLRHLMPDGFGSDRNQYSEAVGRCFIVSMVARAYQPGAKVDTAIILEGSQGVGKTTALEIIGGEFYGAMHETITSKDFLQNLEGKWLVEISEMHSFNKAEVNRIKGILSERVDTYRQSYGRRSEDHRRRCVFAGTTNRDDWNADDTGARRFWPIMCFDVNHQWLRESRDQLFAEATARFKRGESWWDVPDADAKAEQERRRAPDAWENVIRRWLSERRVEQIGGGTAWFRRDRPLTNISIEEVMADALGIPEARWTKADQLRVASALRLMGFTRKRQAGGVRWLYRGDQAALTNASSDESEQPPLI